MLRRRSAAGIALGLAFVGITGCQVPVADDPATATTTATATADTEVVPAVVQDVTEEQKVEARAGNGAVLTLPLELEGIVTWAPEPGTVLRSGDVIVEVGGRPVVLVIGESPLYRPLRLVGAGERDEAGTRLGRQTGADVTQLQQFLVDEGHDDDGRLAADGEFGISTQRAVKAWQRAAGHPATGVVDTSQMIFMTGELLVGSRLTVGQTFERFDVSGTDVVLDIVGSTILREFFPVGGAVDVLADPPTTGVVTRSSRVSGEAGIAQHIEIAVDGVTADASARQDLGQSVQVVGSITRAEDALTVPVRALLALSDGGWEVEVESGSGVERVPVELIDVVDTTAIVSGISEGDQVVVPL